MYGDSRGWALPNKKFWWWNKKVKENGGKTRRKRKTRRKLKKGCNSKKEIKKLMSEAKNETFKHLYQQFDLKEREMNIYIIA